MYKLYNVHVVTHTKETETFLTNNRNVLFSFINLLICVVVSNTNGQRLRRHQIWEHKRAGK
jgi:hypothetical protein